MAGLIAYHGSPSREAFKEFDQARIGSQTDEGLLGAGFYFSTDKEVASVTFRTVKVRLTLAKPFKIQMAQWGDKSKLINDELGTQGLVGTSLTRYLEARGYDGVILDYSPTGYKHKEIAVFDASRIKILSQATKENPRTKTLRQEKNQRIVQCGTRAIWEEKKRGKWMIVGAYFTDDKPGMKKMFEEFENTVGGAPASNPQSRDFDTRSGRKTPRGMGHTRTDLDMVASGQWTRLGKGYFKHKSGVQVKRRSNGSYELIGGPQDGRAWDSLWVARQEVERNPISSRSGIDRGTSDEQIAAEIAKMSPAQLRNGIKNTEETIRVLKGVHGDTAIFERSLRTMRAALKKNPKRDRSGEPKSGRFARKASSLFAKGFDKANDAIQDTAKGKNPTCPSCGGAFRNPTLPGKGTCSGCGAEVEIT